jgi:hypothetical protein
MDSLTNEIKEALRHRLLYAALILTLTLPDACAALESPNGETSANRYKAWWETWLKGKYDDHLTADDVYRLRCAVAHQGRLQHQGLEFDRVFFTLRPNGQFFHKNILGSGEKKALNLDLVWFCKDVVEAAEAWFAQKTTDPQVQKNLELLVQFHPNGMLPFLNGVPAVG